uniref:Uncharacterized protein n=1 Tax=Picea glauca TaxID=3330 RepID=A0A124GMP3_PICGL|nr:hypothetical protein ABT39_MTgene1817 [Picea glauca]QHR91828.1 hypothetical protein Q903MT_gene5864 [Picea sitchensis]
MAGSRLSSPLNSCQLRNLECIIEGKKGIRARCYCKSHQVLLVIWPKWRRFNEALEEQDGSNLTNCFPTRIKVFGHKDII